MTTRAATVNRVSKHRVEITYAADLTEADDGQGVDLSAFGVPQMIGLKASNDFTTGGAVTIEGSLDGITWTAMNNLAGSAISLTAAGQALSAQPYPFVRPRVTAGTSVNITCKVVALVM